MIRRAQWMECLLLAGVLVLAAWLRWTGLAWDSGYLFHPDERQIVLVVSKLQLPANLLEFFSPDSPLNPKFFAYGSLPLYLLRVLMPFAPPTHIVGPWADDQLARWVLFGRWLSGVFDLGTLVVTYALGRRVYGGRVGLLAAACAAFSVLHIQLAHFYAVDTPLTFFTVATMYAALRVAEAQNARVPKKWLALGGILLGLALASKVTALPLLAPLAYASYRASKAPAWKFSRARVMEIWRAVRRPLLTMLGAAGVVFVVTQPYALLDWYTFGRDVMREALVARGWLDYPYTRQFNGTWPVVYQIAQSSLWGMGLPLGIFAWGGGTLCVYQWRKTRAWRDALLVSFALLYFFTIAFQLAKYLRYMLPLLPVLYIMAAGAWQRLLEKRLGRTPLVFAFLSFALVVLSFLYSFAFIQIYTREHTWLVASRWIYQNIPVGKTLAVEEWDDALPVLMQLADGTRRGSEYRQIVLHMYDDDTDAKRLALADALQQADVVVLASQRLYGSIGRNATRYPLMNRYYEKLFDGELGFAPVMTTRSDMNLFGLTIRDDPFANLPFDASRVRALLSPNASVWNWGFADESFSVYDHPQPIVFEKVRALRADEIAKLLQ
jgi:hypothetical protein